MRNFIYSLILSTSLFLTALITQGALAGDHVSVAKKNYPYKIIEIMPSGQIFEHTGSDESLVPKKVIADLNLNLYPEDKVTAFPDPNLGLGSLIQLKRAPVIRLRDGRKEMIVRSWATTAGELLAEKNIELGVDDKTNFRLDSRISDGMNLTIIRVAVTTVIETEDIDYKVVKKPDPDMDKGKVRIEKRGVKGEKKLTYRVTREDGVEVSRVLIDSQISKQPETQIEYYGTKVIVYVSGEASWYNAPAMTAACRDVPRGTMVRVVNLSNGKSVVVKVNDYIGHSGRVIDLSSDAFAQLAPLSQGVIKQVRVEKYYPE